MSGDGGFADAWNAGNEHYEGDAVVNEPGVRKGGEKERGREEVRGARE